MKIRGLTHEVGDTADKILLGGIVCIVLGVTALAPELGLKLAGWMIGFELIGLGLCATDRIGRVLALALGAILTGAAAFAIGGAALLVLVGILMGFTVGLRIF